MAANKRKAVRMRKKLLKTRENCLKCGNFEGVLRKINDLWKIARQSLLNDEIKSVVLD